ncbi:MAG TPA: addiction module toxin, HicA family [Nanoarchaeota archaeon]|nr:type II toxin-antitoxin system HicA family toxin [Candidatus Pacearchaeota archaeon]HIH18184.1 addiction module toxin, HicA family [Nanoarchaeota archaeon]HIH34579.1 addiction module toxin, HicA family [Nanoarchaeota archaeon]HIH51847.1 addiction module toxin, HicA family [Nanoarchaeota archaeon]HIH66546.1 addiction module toxin, HicA family [Nanoarchaeota archaeon]
MSQKLPRISGYEVIKILCNNFNFKVLRQKGSHVTLTNDSIFLTVPLHKELDRGTLNSIIRDSGVSRREFLEYV